MIDLQEAEDPFKATVVKIWLSTTQIQCRMICAPVHLDLKLIIDTNPEEKHRVEARNQDESKTYTAGTSDTAVDKPRCDDGREYGPE